MNGEAVTSQMGLHEGFCECQVCDDCLTNIISQSNVEDLYPIMYIQGETITVHMEHRDIVFTKSDRMLVADFLEWVRGAEDSEDEYDVDDIDLVLMTVQEKGGLYTKKKVERPGRLVNSYAQ